jgi:hypothetical protein
VAKLKAAPYVSERDNNTWFKIRNRRYSQMAGREELFERERAQGACSRLHACTLACAELEKAL